MFIRDSEKEITHRERSEFRKYNDKLASLEKEIRKEIKQKLKEEIQGIKEEASRTVRDIVSAYELRISSESNANMRRSHFI